MKHLLRNWIPVRSRAQRGPQAGALPYRVIDGRPVFLLVTSRRSGRWIFPKGGMIAGATPQQSAAQEALEEAGVEGEIGTEPLGSYRSTANDPGRSLVDVIIYPLEVTVQHDDWQEKAKRHRHWVTGAEAKRLLKDRDKIAIVSALEALLARQGRLEPAAAARKG